VQNNLGMCNTKPVRVTVDTDDGTVRVLVARVGHVDRLVCAPLSICPKAAPISETFSDHPLFHTLLGEVLQIWGKKWTVRTAPPTPPKFGIGQR
jgi:hypothetical protein